MDILSITDEAVVFATSIGWSGYYHINQYSFDNQTVWQVHPDQVNLDLHRELQGYGATNSDRLFIPEWDYSTGQASVLIYNSCVGSIYNYEFGTTSASPNTYIDDEELIIAYRPLNSSNQYSPITHVVGMSLMTGEVRNITTFDQSELLSSTTEGGIEDCSDGSDEVDWDESNNPGFPGNFTCEDGTEIQFWNVNNGWHQCANGEDEWYPDGYIAMNDGWDLLVLGDIILFRSGWDAWYLEF